MAVTRMDNVINLGAAEDLVTGRLRVQGFWAGAAATLQSGPATARVTVWQATAAGQAVTFTEPMQFDSLYKSAGTGNLFVYLT